MCFLCVEHDAGYTMLIISIGVASTLLAVQV